jgi:hypothetical protein
LTVTVPESEPRRPILTMSPSASRIGRFAETQASQFRRVLWPIQQLDRAVDRRAFLVAGDQEGDRSGRRAVFFDMARHGGDETGDPALHVDRTAPVHHAASISAENGGCDQAASSPTGTTSVWPANIRCGPLEPSRA